MDEKIKEDQIEQPQNPQEAEQSPAADKLGAEAGQVKATSSTNGDQPEKKVDPKKFHQEYLEWKKESKGGKVRYYLNNVLFTGLLFTAVFALLLAVYNQWGYAWLKKAAGYTVGQTFLYIGIFLVLYSLMLFLIYFFSWRSNEKKFAAYDKAVMALLAKKKAEKAANTATAATVTDDACDAPTDVSTTMAGEDTDGQ